MVQIHLLADRFILIISVVSKLIACCVLSLLFFINICIASETPEQSWRRAIDRDDAKVLWRMLPDTDVQATNEKGKTALMAAAKLGDVKLLEALLSRGLSLEDRSFTGGTVLMYAALGNQLEMLDYLQQRVSGTQYRDAQSTNGWTAIMIAAAKGFDDAVKVLVDDGADPWLADAYQWSPLMRAIDNRHMGVVRYLLSLPDGMTNFKNENGSTALHISALRNDIESTSLLLALGAKPEIKDNSGRTPADIAKVNASADLLALLGKE